MIIGAGAQLLLGGSAHGIDWPMAFVAGLAGSFIGGLLISLLNGDGIELQAERHHRLARRRVAPHRRLAVVAPPVARHRLTPLTGYRPIAC